MGLFDKKRKGTAVATPPAGPVRLLKVGDFLTEKTVLLLDGGPGKQEVLDKLMQCLSLPDPQAAMKAVTAREEAGSTVLEPGLFVPHARLAGLKTIQAALAVIPGGLQVQNPPAAAVRLALLFLSPADNMKSHLAFLASAASLFQNDGLRDALTQTRDPLTALSKIRAAEVAL
jgi:PTS system nitrogen regulatory IIA component